jgi:hypothetical protein
METLEDDRRPSRELGEHARDLGDPGERLRAPGDVLRVVAELELCACLDQAEAGMAEAGLGDQAVGVACGEEVVEATVLVARDM